MSDTIKSESSSRCNYLVCVDSDGTVMDTMWVKHSRCLGPALVSEWELMTWEDSVLRIWYDINLFHLTRGIVRFKALALALRKIHESITPIDGIELYEAWAENTATLNEATLREIAVYDQHPIFQKALHWSETVNQKVAALTIQDKIPFPGAEEGLSSAKLFADIAVISTANRDALYEEWESYHLLPYVDFLLAQDSGSKTQCIAALIREGYDPSRILMIGDAPSDLTAAQNNKVAFYPILAGREEESWEELRNHGFESFCRGYYSRYEAQKLEEFYHNLGGNDYGKNTGGIQKKS